MPSTGYNTSPTILVDHTMAVLKQPATPPPLKNSLPRNKWRFLNRLHTLAAKLHPLKPATVRYPQVMTQVPAGNGIYKIRFLDGLRGLAAMMVVIAHTQLCPSLVLGAPAVDIFFVLSAFLLTMGFDKKVQTLLQHQASYKRWGWTLLDYAQRRFLRVYPLFTLVTIYLSFLSREHQRKMYLVRNHYNIWKVLTFEMPYRYFVFWTLPLEIAYYFVIPVFAIAIVKLRNYWWLPLVPTVVYIGYSGCTLYRWWDQPLKPHFLTFLTGSIAAVVYNRIDAWISYRGFVFRWYHIFLLRTVQYLNVVILLSVIFQGLAFHWIMANPVPQTPGVPFIHGNLAIILVCEMLRPGAIATFLEMPLLRYAGKVSFSMYLWHHIASTYANQDPETWDGVWGIWLSVFFVSTISYHAFEVPMFRLASFIGHRIRERDAQEVQIEHTPLPTRPPVTEVIVIAEEEPIVEGDVAVVKYDSAVGEEKIWTEAIAA